MVLGALGSGEFGDWFGSELAKTLDPSLALAIANYQKIPNVQHIYPISWRWSDFDSSPSGDRQGNW